MNITHEWSDLAYLYLQWKQQPRKYKPRTDQYCWTTNILTPENYLLYGNYLWAESCTSIYIIGQLLFESGSYSSATSDRENTVVIHAMLLTPILANVPNNVMSSKIYPPPPPPGVCEQVVRCHHTLWDHLRWCLGHLQACNWGSIRLLQGDHSGGGSRPVVEKKNTCTIGNL